MGRLTEDAPVQPGEFVLRRIHKNDRKKKSPGFIRMAFGPSKNDTDGLSVFREHFSSAIAVASAARQTSENYFIARLSVRELRERFGLTVVPSPDPGQPEGHAVIPEINTQNMDEHASKEKQASLADFAWDFVVHSPS